MSRNTELLQQRDKHVCDRFRTLRKKHHQWRIEEIIKQVAKEVFLSDVTIVKILKRKNEDNVPSHPTMIKLKK